MKSRETIFWVMEYSITNKQRCWRHQSAQQEMHIYQRRTSVQPRGFIYRSCKYWILNFDCVVGLKIERQWRVFTGKGRKILNQEIVSRGKPLKKVTLCGKRCARKNYVKLWIQKIIYPWKTVTYAKWTSVRVNQIDEYWPRAIDHENTNTLYKSAHGGQ